MKNVMIDIETLGTRPGSIILSIGACAFDPADISSVGSDARYEFYENIDPEDCKSLGLTSDPSTVAWWAKQGPEAVAMLQTDRQQLIDVLNRFRSWWSNVGGKYPLGPWLLV